MTAIRRFALLLAIAAASVPCIANATRANKTLILIAGRPSHGAGEHEFRLTGKEFEVLTVLEEHRDKVVPRERLMAEVWPANWYGSTKTLDVTIGRLRNKLQQAGLADRVVSIRGVGFRLEHTRPAE